MGRWSLDTAIHPLHLLNLPPVGHRELGIVFPQPPLLPGLVGTGAPERPDAKPNVDVGTGNVVILAETTGDAHRCPKPAFAVNGPGLDLAYRRSGFDGADGPGERG